MRNNTVKAEKEVKTGRKTLYKDNNKQKPKTIVYI